MTKTPANKETPATLQPEAEKQPYSAPKLKEHGSVEDVTLQTFFGSFSPAP